MWFTILTLLACSPEPEDTDGSYTCDTGPFTAEQPEENFLADFPPAVVRTWPRNGDQAVDPGLTEIEVVFSKDMSAGHTWIMQREENYPNIGSVRWEGPRVHVAEVSLEPGTVYYVQLNRIGEQDFRDRNDNALLPYPLTFRTADY